MNAAALDMLLDCVEVQLEAFAVCEIGRDFSLRCDPIDAIVVHFVLKGDGVLDCEHGSYALPRGSVVVVPKNLPKHLRGSGAAKEVRDAGATCPLDDGLIHFRALCGDADLILGCATISANVGGRVPLFDHVARPIVAGGELTMLAPLFDIMLEELRRPGVGTRAFVSAVMKQILVVLLRSGDTTVSEQLLPLVNGKLGRAVAAVLTRPQDNHTLESMAASAGMSRARFCHHFSAAHGCSPKAFVQAVRLSSAAKLLRGSNLPVKSIAASVGYASRSHFSRAFQARFGLDPSAFRQQGGVESLERTEH
jgi:AraC-like DNA-binding protein